MATLTRTLDQYETTASQELVVEKKNQAQTRIEGFRTELKEMREELVRLKQIRSDGLYEKNRSELIERRVNHTGTHTHQRHNSGNLNDGDISENPYTHNNSSSRSDGTYTNMTREEGMLKEHDVLSRAGDQLDEFLERGRMVLENLGEQREMLLNTRRKIYSVANTLGISNETIRLVERRAKQDKRIFYGGLILLIVCFYYIIKWFL